MVRSRPSPAQTDSVLRALKDAAEDMRTITHAELTSVAELALPDIGPQLRYIRDRHCIDHGRPWPTMVALDRGQRIQWPTFPSVSARRSPARADRSVDEQRWRGIVMQVYAFDWSDVDLDQIGGRTHHVERRSPRSLHWVGPVKWSLAPERVAATQ